MEAIRKVEQCAHHVMALLENADWRMTTSSHVGFLMQGIQSTRTSSKCYATLLRRAKARFMAGNGSGSLKRDACAWGSI